MDTNNNKANLIDTQNVDAKSDIEANVIEWIRSRRSIGKLDDPAPSHEQVNQAIECAMTAPDHKRLQPWRFHVIEGDARHRLGDAFLQAARDQAARNGEALMDKVEEKTLNLPLRAPMIITVVTKMQYHEKVPEYEQLLSAGAAVENMILALKAQGFNTVWRTGLLANEPAVKAYFNVGPDDYVVAFVYVGSNEREWPERKLIDTSEFVAFDS